MSYIAIQNSDIVVGKPGKQSLWQKIKDNFDFLFGKTNAMGLANGSFELDSDADGIPDSWTRSLYPGGSGGFETTNPEHGALSYYFTHPGGAGNGGGYLESDYTECSEAEQYSLKHFIRSSVTGIKNIVQIHYYTKAKVFVSSVDLYNATAPDTAASYKSYNFTPPSTARYFKVRLIGGYTDTAVAGSTYFDGVQLDQVIDASVTQSKIAAAAVGQAQLKNATGAVSMSGGSYSNLTLPGGEYGFQEQIKGFFGSGGANVDSMRSNNYAATTSYVTVIALKISTYVGSSDIAYAQQRYIQASPPYMVGNTLWGHFLFILRDIATGTVRAAYEAEDPPWAYNGAVYLPKDDPGRLSEVPHPFADYWQKDPAIDGLEIVMVDLSTHDTKKWKADNAKLGKGILEDLGAVVKGKGVLKAHADYLLPNIPKFTDKVKIITP